MTEAEACVSLRRFEAAGIALKEDLAASYATIPTECITNEQADSIRRGSELWQELQYVLRTYHYELGCD